MAGLRTILHSMLTSHLTVLRDFWPLVMLAIVGAVLATAYYWATKPGELLSFWATWVNKQYAKRTLLYQTPIPGKKQNVIADTGKAPGDYYDDATTALAGNEYALDAYGIRLREKLNGGYVVTYNGVTQHLTKTELDTYLSRLIGPELTYVDNEANTERHEKYQWVLKPILTCERCIGGQFGFWLSVLAILNGAYLSLLSVLFVVALTSLLSSLIVREFNR